MLGLVEGMTVSVCFFFLISSLYHLSGDDRQGREGHSPLPLFPVVDHSCQLVRADGRLIGLSVLTETLWPTSPPAESYHAESEGQV